MHHSEEFGENFPGWRKRKSYIRYLPPYSPELNPTEIVWKFAKQYRLPISAYLSCENFVSPVEYVLKI
ncbi:MAG: hypothetical protein HC887_05040 [Desulfobacteraceae bacterium]|nr:hypothetical protein [Desulfobacteraceae bacterium]